MRHSALGYPGQVFPAQISTGQFRAVTPLGHRPENLKVLFLKIIVQSSEKIVGLIKS